MGVLRFRVLGPVLVERDGRQIGLAVEQRTLLAVLLLRAGEPVSVHDLGTSIWAHDPPIHLRAALQTLVSRLRAALGADGRRLRSVTGGYSIEVGADQLDLLCFQRLVKAADAIRGQNDEEELELLRRALELWDGDPLSSVESEDLTLHAVPVLMDSCLAALERKIELEVGLGRHTQLVPELRALVARHPYRERLWAQLIRALHLGGRQADALSAFRAVDRLLADELGIRPGAELRELHQSILLDGDSDQASPEPEWVVHDQLPLESEFVGRDDVIDELEAGLIGRHDRMPFVVLSGVPGGGKTALALRLARRAEASYPDGRWFVRLGGAGHRPRDPGEVLAEMLVATGLREANLPAGTDARAALLRSRLSRRQVLVVFDDAASAEQVRPLLPGTACNAVIVTSRRQLTGLSALNGAQSVSVDVLTADDATDLLRQLTALDLEQRARLARLCGGLPLALRIAAANLGVQPDFLDRLEQGDRLSRLAVHDDPEAMVLNAFERSYDGLDATAAGLFRLAGLVPGADFTAEVVGDAAGLPTDQAQSALDRLAEASLVQQPRPGRYLLHDLLRLYAVRLVRVSGAEEAGRQALFTAYLDRLDAAIALIAPTATLLPRPASSAWSPDCAAAEAWIDAEYRSLVAVAVSAAEHGPLELAWLVADRLSPYFHNRDCLGYWRTAAEAGLAAAEEAGEQQAIGAMQRSLGALLATVGDLSASREALRRSVIAYQAAGDIEGEARALNFVGIVEATLSTGVVALEHFCRAHELALRTSSRHLQATTELNKASMLRQTGRLDEAMVAMTQAQQSFVDAGRRPGDYTQQALGHLLQERGDLAAARRCLEEEVDALRERGLKVGLAEALQRLAAIFCDDGDFGAGEKYAQEALDLSLQTGDELVACHAQATLAEALLGINRPEAAIELYCQALSLARRTKTADVEVRALAGLAAARLRRGEVTAALASARAAVTQTDNLERPILRGRVLVTLAATCHAAGLTTEAEAAAREAVAIHTRSNALGYLSEAQDALALLTAAR